MILPFTLIILSLVILAAHFFRSGNVILSMISIVLIGLLTVRRSTAARLLQVSLVLGTLEWIRTLVELVAQRSDSGQPFLRLALILGGVALLTASSVLLFRTSRLRGWFGMQTNN